MSHLNAFEWVIIAAIVLILLAIPFGNVVFDKLLWNVRAADIEQLRSDVANAPDGKAEDIFGKATDFNRDLAKKKALNASLLTDLLVADEWDSVEPIDVRGVEVQ